MISVILYYTGLKEITYYSISEFRDYEVNFDNNDSDAHAAIQTEIWTVNILIIFWNIIFTVLIRVQNIYMDHPNIWSYKKWKTLVVKELITSLLWDPYPSHHNGLFSPLLVLRDFTAREADQYRCYPNSMRLLTFSM